MLAKIRQFVKTHQDDIILLIGVILISLLSFAVGYIVAKQQEKEPIRIEDSRIFTNLATNCTNIRDICVYIRGNSREL
ncbi:MAG: hypothetical protein QME61_00490 [Patescibacteria group bacterium]|nr:hypothetical protein [Patescibacteria group bacterium]